MFQSAPGSAWGALEKRRARFVVSPLAGLDCLPGARKAASDWPGPLGDQDSYCDAAWMDTLDWSERRLRGEREHAKHGRQRDKGEQPPQRQKPIARVSSAGIKPGHRSTNPGHLPSTPGAAEATNRAAAGTNHPGRNFKGGHHGHCTQTGAT